MRGIAGRLATSFAALLVLAMLGLALASLLLVRAQTIELLAEQLAIQARLVSLLAPEAAGPPSGPEAAWGAPAAADPDGLAKRVGRELGARLTLIAPDGRVLGDSDADPAEMENHAGRPEVAAAFATGSGRSVRHSATVGQDFLYVAVRDGSGGVVRVALPVAALDRALLGAWGLAVALIAAAGALAVLLALVVARRITRPLASLAAAAQAVAAGELDRPIPVETRDEVGTTAAAFAAMAARLRQALAEARRDRDEMSAVFEQMADGLLIVEPPGVVTLANPAAERVLGLPPGGARGRGLVEVLRDHELIELVRAALADPGRSGGTRQLESAGPWGPQATQELAWGDGPRRVVRALVTPAGGPVVVLLQDLTELRRLETARRDFVANISHELRTPLAALKALVETLEGPALADPAAAREFLARMHVEVDGLAQLVQELLELARIESGAAALRRAAADPSAVVARAAERLRPQAERAGLELVVTAPAGLPAVWIDAARIEQVVTNLVHNAVKFTPPGGRVAVEVAARAGQVAVSVADTGVGIAPEEQPRVFERFYKGDRSRSGGGTGLGLAIAKHIVQAHGGQIGVASQPGAGSVFTFTLPVVRSGGGAGERGPASVARDAQR